MSIRSSMEAVADSSVLVAAFNSNDSQHARAVKLLKKAKKPIFVSEYVAVETLGVLLARVNKQRATEFARILLEEGDLRFLAIPPGFFRRVAEFYFTLEKSLSFVDCSLLVLSQKHTVLTYDRALTREIESAGKKRSDSATIA